MELWYGIWEIGKTRKGFMEAMTFEPIYYWLGRSRTQKWKRDILSSEILWALPHTNPVQWSFFLKYLVSFICLLFYFLMTAHVGLLPKISSVYTLVHLLRSNSSAPFCMRIPRGPSKQRPSLHPLCCSFISHTSLYYTCSFMYLSSLQAWTPKFTQIPGVLLICQAMC